MRDRFGNTFQEMDLSADLISFEECVDTFRITPSGASKKVAA
jgi:hypothetical protein